VNRAILEMSGFAKQDLLGKPSSSFVHPDDAEAAAAQMRMLVSGRQIAARAERRYIAAGGRVFWANVTAALVRNEAGEPQFVLALLENISERKQAEAELRETNERLSIWVQQLEQRTREIGLLSDMGDLLRACRSPEEACQVIVPIAAKLFPDSMGMVSVIVDGAGPIVEPAARWGGVHVQDAFGVSDCWALRRGRAHVVTNREEGPMCRHLANLEGRGAMCVPIMAHGELLGVLSVLVREGSDLTDPRQRLVTTVSEHVSLALANLRLEESLRSQSIRDPLTGLFNRRYMEESLEREMRRAIRNRASVGIIMLDLDHFKSINDTHGHDGGDAMLRAVGAVLQRSIRAEDIACRYGGEEFTLILPDASLHEAAQRADYIRQAVKQLVVAHRRQNLPTITMSAGVATYPDHGPTADAVLRAADTALYQAKARGRDLVVLNQTGGLFPDSLVEYGRR
jgi:diguanylate cyclase (GGDEF)-like protein/PAS domain S-box-containing protein